MELNDLLEMKLSSFLSCSCFFSSRKKSKHYRIQDEQILPNLNTFPYDELKVATGSFSSYNKIGGGGFGSVYKGRLKDGRVVAVKVLSAESNQGDKEFLSEIASMSSINHENLVRLLGCCISGPSRILVYDHMQNNSLLHLLHGEGKNRAKLKWKSRREIGIGIAKALAYIHEEVEPHIVHRDIKPSNILLDQNLTPKLADFGLSRLFPHDFTHITTKIAGTLGFLAPEYAVSGRLTRKSDVYSFGILLLEIVSGRTAVGFNLEDGEFFLAQKAWEMYESDKLKQLVDPTLNGTFSEDEALRFLKVALLCVQEKSNLRPAMSTAVRMMSGEMDVSSVNITPPGLINIMDVKIVQNQPPSSNLCKSKTRRFMYYNIR